SGRPDRIPSTAPTPFSGLRQARITAAPARASSRAVLRPSPLFPPVTSATRPVWAGMWGGGHFSAIRTGIYRLTLKPVMRNGDRSELIRRTGVAALEVLAAL